MKNVVLSLCDYSGNVVRPWAIAGYKCICVDIQHEKAKTENFESGGTILYLPKDILKWEPPKFEYKIAFAFPPCDHLAVSGSRWMAGKGLKALIQGLTLVERCREICESLGCPWMIENPISTLSTYWRKPDYIFDPHQYAGYLHNPENECYTKKTCIWCSQDFIMPKHKALEPVLGSKMHKMPPSQNRKNLRSETPRGFSQAIFESNHDS